MKNDIIKILLSCVLLIGYMTLSAQVSQYGLIVNGGIGHVKHHVSDTYGSFQWKEFDYKAGFSVGFRLRFKNPAPNSFHYDMDLNVGAKVLVASNYIYTPLNEDGYAQYEKVGKSNTGSHYYTSLGGTVNYSISKNLSVGLGIEPIYYLNKESKNKVDVPIVVKVAYDFGKVEIGISGKYGMTEVLESSNLYSAKLRDIQLSLFIPF